MSVRPTIGSDPEFFIRDTQTGIPTPVCGLLGGTKGSPIQYDTYGVQEDNVMCEYNTPPTNEAGRFARITVNGRNAVMDVLRSKHGSKFEPDLAPSRLFGAALLESPQAKMFGCSPDFDAYQLGIANRRITPEELTDPGGNGWRFSGGHVHVGYKAGAKCVMPEYVAAQFADVFIGLNIVTVDKQGERRKHYGTAGRYRPTSYGIEYRTPSNVWTYNLSHAECVGYYAIALGYFLMRPEEEIKRAWAEIPWLDVKRAIESEDATLADTLRSYCNSLGLEL